MGAINELMYKNCVPPDYEKYLLQMFTNTFHLLQSVVHEAEDSSNRLRLDALDDT